MGHMAEIKKQRAPRNRTLSICDDERSRLTESILFKIPNASENPPLGIAHGKYRDWIQAIPNESVDLLFLDPPYNLNKAFDGLMFSRQKESQYTEWLDSVLVDLKPVLKETASIYICGDWRTSHSIFETASRHFMIHNRITWEREKGRGAQKNWKNSSEDIWFCTVSKNFVFNVEAVKLRRQVIAPYKDENGSPKDWETTKQGKFRDTHPSNIWTDITIPFWSMPENTDHPTQKSEKLLAKILMASTHEGDFIFDPFLGSGTTAVVAKKLNRKFFGVEASKEYCLWAAKRLELADTDSTIQGFADGVFWERNTSSLQLTKQDVNGQ
jgi:site-specific DNA-methyltransferase (adenine-specific)